VSTINRALADQLLGSRSLPAAAHAVALGAIAWVSWGALPPAVFGPWAAVVALVVGARTMLWARARRDGWPPRRAASMVRAIMAALGLAWGVGVAFAASYLSITATAMVLLTLAGLASAGTTTLAPDRWAYPVYAGAMFAPTLVGVALEADSREHLMSAALILAFVAFTTRLHRVAHAALHSQLRNEALLRVRDRQLAEAQATANVGSWELDLQTNQVTWSDEAYRLYGLALGSPVSYEVFLARVHPGDRPRVKALVDQRLAEQRDIEYEFRVVRPDGSIRAFLGRNVVTKDDNGRAVRFAGTSLDITERKAIEDALRAAVQEVKTLRGYLRICANCRRVAGQDGRWEQLEAYIRRHSEAEFSHGICPDCAATWATSVR
jgi:PAS domain S-box-containing protein